ncbi:lysine transporter LysM [Vibrio sp. JPW-9-11-11]|uniref:LysM-like peptidoglycan-binding domain-containing protein n=1 Tax=Vibrio sp. JPW-9-11-11 TaxID=1416532 RepID=UPI0015942F2E|nr:LysM-like peptidoglycan-binding domain-containing protein [Vibrio sp. JPW-9-11-11]NVD05570.1 lysine transporter LysM [Vibrio sp. JPW-9-11-11]
MNRRKKKRQQQVDYVELVTTKLSSIDWSNPTHRVRAQWHTLPKLHQRALMVLAPLLLLLLILPAPNAEVVKETSEPQVNERVAVDINTRSLSEQKSVAQQVPASDIWKEYQVKSGDTLAKVFRSNGLAMADLNALVKVEGADKPLSQIKQGQLVRFKLDENGQLDILQLEKSNQSVMFFRLSDGGFGRSK